jgi:HTH-type transcriptional regulator, glycine betaine synthesis regulator
MLPALIECRNLLVRRWGEMGGYWGINRTMAEIHALLFVSGEPLCTDDIMAQLHISRGNASMNLRGLVDWGLIQRQHRLGDRKEYFQADTDVWHMFETIMRERRRREVEPIIDSIERCRAMIAAPGQAPPNPPAREFLQRLDDLQRFLSAMGTLFEMVVQFGPDGVDGLLQFASSDAPANSHAPSAPGLPRQADRRYAAAGKATGNGVLTAQNGRAAGKRSRAARPDRKLQT